MLAQLFEDEGTVSVVLGQHVEQFDGGQQGPSVGTCPVVGRLVLQSLNIAVAIYSLLGHPHALDEVLIHGSSLIEILGLSRIHTTVGHSGNAHIHVVEPDGVALRTMTGKRAVRQTILSILYKVKIIFNNRGELGVILSLGHCIFHHGRAHRAAVVERTGMQYLFHLPVLALLLFAELRCHLTNEVEAGLHVVFVFCISRNLSSSQECLIGDAPLVGADAEGSALQRSVFLQGMRRLGIHVLEDTVEGCQDVLLVQFPVRHLIVGLQQMKRCGGIVNFFLGFLLCTLHTD